MNLLQQSMIMIVTIIVTITLVDMHQDLIHFLVQIKVIAIPMNPLKVRILIITIMIIMKMMMMNGKKVIVIFMIKR